MSSKKRFSLKNLYEDESVRNTVETVLGEDFDDSFERLIKESKELQSGLTNEFQLKKAEIKEMFIEYGHKMVTLMDLKNIYDLLPRYYSTEWGIQSNLAE